MKPYKAQGLGLSLRSPSLRSRTVDETPGSVAAASYIQVLGREVTCNMATSCSDPQSDGGATCASTYIQLSWNHAIGQPLTA
jgi:hypothetical protein